MVIPGWMKKVTKQLATEPTERASLMLRQAINDFADRIAGEHPPGSTVRFRFLPTCPSGLKQPDWVVATGTMAKCQVVPGELPQHGIMLEVPPDVLPQIPAWRIYGNQGNPLVQVGFAEIVEG